MIKRLKKPCWIYACDKCGKPNLNISAFHFKTKKEAQKMKDKYLERWEGKMKCLCRECIEKIRRARCVNG